MKNALSPRILKSAALLTMGCLALSSAQASGINEPPTDVLPTPGSVGLGAITQIEASPYKGASTRGDLLPLYLYDVSGRFCIQAVPG